jgi:hypothetical protein
MNSLKAITKLNISSGQRYSVIAYFLPEFPYKVDGREIFSYVNLLKVCNTEREAVEYRNFVEKTTGHSGVFVCDSVMWQELSTRNQKIRFTKIPENLENDITNHEKVLAEKERQREIMIKEFEDKLKLENDPSTIEHYCRNVIDGYRASERIKMLEQELLNLKEINEEKTQLIIKHKNDYPEHDEKLLNYIKDNMGNGYSQSINIYLNNFLK